jgi:hypothetical protein
MVAMFQSRIQTEAAMVMAIEGIKEISLRLTEYDLRHEQK